jgi:hypothetical protein
MLGLFVLKQAAAGAIGLPLLALALGKEDPLRVGSAAAFWILLSVLAGYREAWGRHRMFERRLRTLYPGLACRRIYWFELAWLTPFTTLALATFLAFVPDRAPVHGKRAPFPIRRAGLFWSVAVLVGFAVNVTAFESTYLQPLDGRAESARLLVGWIGPATYQHIADLAVGVQKASTLKRDLKTNGAPPYSGRVLESVDASDPTSRILGLAQLVMAHMAWKKEKSIGRVPAGQNRPEKEVEFADFQLLFIEDVHALTSKPFPPSRFLAQFNPLSLVSPCGVMEVAALSVLETTIIRKFRVESTRMLVERLGKARESIERSPASERPRLTGRLEELRSRIETPAPR